MLFVLIICAVALGVSYLTGVSLGWAIAAVVAMLVVFTLYSKNKEVRDYNRRYR